MVLGIESSCDDSSVAVLEDGTRLRAHLIAAQDLHKLYGGVVPELAARAHLDLLPRMVEQALAEAQLAPGDLTGIAVTYAPGLVGSLVVGVALAKAYAYALGIPVVGVNHIEAHLHAASRSSTSARTTRAASSSLANVVKTIRASVMGSFQRAGECSILAPCPGLPQPRPRFAFSRSSPSPPASQGLLRTRRRKAPRAPTG